MSKVTSREQCPVCAEQGHDTKGDNLAVYSDGHKFCFACGYTVGKHGITEKVRLPKNLMDTSIPHKCVGERTCKAWEISEEYVGDCKGTGTIVFPYYSNANKLIGVKYRDFHQEKISGDKEIWFDGEPDLFGWHMKSSQTECIIWEGETDTLNGWQQNSHILHLGLPGVKLAEKLIRKNAMALREFKKIYICLDNDDEGLSARSVIAGLLPAFSTYDMRISESYKDFTEACQNGEGQKVYKDAIRSSHPFSLEDLLTGDELKKQTLEYFNDTAQFQGYSTGLPAFDELLSGGMHLGEVILLVGHTGRGKSTFTAFLARHMAKQGCKVMWAGSEMYPMQMMRKFIEEYLGRRLYWKDNDYSVSKEEIEEALDELCKSIVFFNAMAGDFERLQRSIITAIHQHGVNVIFLDVLSDVAENFSDWQIASEVMQKLVNIAQGNPTDRRPPVSFFCCAHTKGDESEDISLSDIRGGSAVRQKATLILSFEGEVDEPVRQIRVLKKSRMFDSTVPSCEVVFDLKKRRYKELGYDEESSGAEGDVSPRKRLGLRAQKNSNNSELSSRFRSRRLRENSGS